MDALIKDAYFENSELECKARLDRNKPEGWLKSIAGFSNSIGGTLYIGIEDKSNKLLGFARHEADVERNFLTIR